MKLQKKTNTAIMKTKIFLKFKEKKIKKMK